MVNQILQIYAPRSAELENLISRLCKATEEDLRGAKILDQRAASKKVSEFINCYKVVTKSKERQATLNRKVNEKKGFQCFA